MDFSTGAEMIACCNKEQINISEAMLRREEKLKGIGRKQVIEQMGNAWQIMRKSMLQPLREPRRSMGGLIGGESKKIHIRSQSVKPICGDVTMKAITYAMGVLEVNASMGLIVAAPTAGSSGVIPGVFLAVQEEFGLSDSDILDGLFHSAAVGYLITRNATVSGAQGGCQAEIGSASAMAASAVTQMMGGPPEQCLAAASLALSNLMGLVCDPVAGLVETPCQKRNAIGAANALICAEMALSGVEELIPFDEMVEAMYQVGMRLPMELRETALGGVAATPTACRIRQKITALK